MRGRLWEPESYADPAALPTSSEMFSDQLNLPKPAVPEEQVIAGYRTQL